MDKIIHARLDREAQRLLERLRRQTGLNNSLIVREGLKALASLTLSPRNRMPVGVGQFESGIPDLGSNRKHLEGFGS